MRGRTLSIIGALLTLVSASGSAETAASIAQSRSPASRESAELPQRVPLLPLEEGHEARRVQRVIGRQSTWRPIAQSATTPVAPALPASARRTYLPAVDQPDIEERHKVIAMEVLNLLPASCQRQIKNFYVRYDKPERRGLAGKSTIIMDGTLADEEFRAVLVHEALGHLFDLGCLQGSSAAGMSGFKDGSDPIFNDDPSLAFYRISWVDDKQQRPVARPEDFVSGYAQTDPFEDLAESAIYYVLQNRTFVERAKTNRTLAVKLKWLQTFMPVVNPERSRGVTPMQNDALAAAWSGQIPWDATKLRYAWTATTVANR